MTNSEIKLIKSLSLKKNRLKHQLFVVEGKKNVQELLSSDYEVQKLYATNNWIDINKGLKVQRVSNIELNRVSNQSSPNEVLALVKIKKHLKPPNSAITLILDDINDPGNMGTIIRICDWFGVYSVVSSNNTVDIYNPKVVQSTMGSIFRVAVTYTDLTEYMRHVKVPIYGAFMNGNDVNNVSFAERLCLVMGNESKGINKDLLKYIDNSVCVKNVGGNAESLNVATATSILLHAICS